LITLDAAELRLRQGSAFVFLDLMQDLHKMNTTHTLSSKVLIVSSFALIANIATAAEQRQQISIVGSSTVFPFASAVAEHLGQSGKVKTPTVESTGTGGGFKVFCGGTGPNYPDIANASRKIKPSEIKNCQSNGVSELVEVKIGFDGIVMGQSKKEKPINLTRKQIYLALAKQVPPEDCQDCGKLIDNPYKTWNQIDSTLPNHQIEVLGPPPSSGTRDAFAELALEAGCTEFEWLKEWKKKNEEEYKRMCQTIREDGAYVEAGENDNLIVQKLSVKPGAFGIFGYSFLDSNRDKVTAATIEKVNPTADSIADGLYPISRPLFFYVKKAHVGQIPGLQDYIDEFTSEKAFGDEGYLVDKGLVPLPTRLRNESTQSARKLEVLKP
jgi:phosphate transport system substrate-binding protein